MRKLHLLGFLLTTYFAAVASGASGSGGTVAHSLTGDSLIGKTWTLVLLAGQEIGPGPALTLRFEADGSLGGFDGCNHYRGSSIIEGTALRISGEMATTRAACGEALMNRANAYTEVLIHTTSFFIDHKKLILHDTAGDKIAVFEADSQSLAGTSWEVIAYNNGKQAVVSVLGGTHVSVRFGDDGGISGSAGCNQYFAEYLGVNDSITIGPPGTTRRFCATPEGAMEQEALYLEALQSATSFRLEGERLTLRTSSGALAVTLVRNDSTVTPAPAASETSKIRFDLARLDKNGLQGPPDGLRALDYEYCIPNRPDAMAAVRATDPTLQIQQSSPGRVGCGASELLCLGNTHQSDYRTVLERLSELAFITEIHEAFFE